MSDAQPPPAQAIQTMPESMDFDKLSTAVSCFAEMIYRTNGVWEGPDPLTPIIPLFVLQIMIAIFGSRLLNYALKPFNQPPIVAEILSGIIIGPSVLGRFDGFRKLLFPNFNFEVMETMAHFALVLFAFITGLQMDTKAITQTGTKARIVAVAGTVFPFLIGSLVYYIIPTDSVKNPGFMFAGGALTVTGFAVLAKILDAERLLATDIGKVSITSALIHDALAWPLLAVALISTFNTSDIAGAVICTGAYALFCLRYIRQALEWAVQKTPEGQGQSEFYVCSLLVGMCVSGCIVEALGTHPMIGAFLFGLIVPGEALKNMILDRIEDFVMGILMPVFYVVCGLRANVDVIGDGINVFVVLLLIVLSFVAKIVGAVLVSSLTGFTAGEAVRVGVLTSAKSVMAFIILEVGQVQEALTTQTYTILVIVSLVMTMAVTPLTKMYRPAQNLVPYKRRTIQNAKPEEELRLLACVHNTNNLPSIISLLESSNATKTTPIAVHGVQLIELVGRAPAMLVVHSSGSGRHTGVKNMSHEEVQTSQIINAFDNYELRSEGVTTQVLTCRSPFGTMAEDVCKLAKEKRASFLILPFHKQQGPEGEMEDINPAIQSVNEGVLVNAPCSVGILIERGGRTERTTKHAKNIAMLYLGGPDDREALTYALRMADLPDAHLTVIRFLPNKESNNFDDEFDTDFEFQRERSFVTISIDVERDKEMDEEFLNNFRETTAEYPSVTMLELVLEDEEEFIKAVKSLDNRSYDLYVVGRGRAVTSPLTAGLADWCECPELGAVGDLLVTSDFESSFSVVVVQQYLRTSRSAPGSVLSAESISQRMDADMQMEMGFRLSFGDGSSGRAGDGGGDGFDPSGTSFNRRPEHSMD